MVVDVFGAGMETTALMMAFSLIALANRPHIQKKVAGVFQNPRTVGLYYR